MMKSLCVCLLLMCIGGSIEDLPPSVKAYKILMLLPASSKSHRNVFMPIATALADRGHKIVMLTNHDKPTTHPNIREICHGLKHMDHDHVDMFEARNASDGVVSLFRRILPLLARDMYTLPEVKEIYDKRKEFDLLIIDHIFNEFMYPFAYEMPFITVATTAMDQRQSAILGNPINPAYMPNFLGTSDVSNLLGVIKNTFNHIFLAVYWRHWAVVPFIQKEIDVQFPGLPSLLDIERNQSLTLMNYHYSMDIPLPLLPSQVEVAGMQCRPARPLPEDLTSWILGSGSAGVIYFSLGSIAKGTTMPVVYRDMFIEAFKRMDQRIIWKFEGELDEVPKNVMIQSWLPQQDIIAHPKVKVFITHGGVPSTQESIYHATPMLVLPIFGDQPRNAAKIAAQELGLQLVWEELTVDIIVESLREIINNPKYRENAAAVSSLFKDQMESPTDRAVFWTEYVIRHRGAPRLRSPAEGLTWLRFLLLDVLAVVLLALFIFLYFMCWIVKMIGKVVFNDGDKKRNKKKKRE